VSVEGSTNPERAALGKEKKKKTEEHGKGCDVVFSRDSWLPDLIRRTGFINKVRKNKKLRLYLILYI
jgi:hypothetical protein